MTRWGAAVVGGLLSLCVSSTVWAQAPVLPPPSYDTTLWAFAYPWVFNNGTTGATAVAELEAQGFRNAPYVRWGLSQYYIVNMPWNQDLANPVVTPSLAQLTDILSTLQSLGSTLHMTLEGGMSRAPEIYLQAKLADRRNAQWYGTGAIVSPAQQAALNLNGTASVAYTSASRYARKLRLHMETKLRAFARRMVQLRAAYPDTLISASGDAEAELNFEALLPGVPYEAQLITDYSPFAVLEFRDWILHVGLYADDGPYAGQGYQKRNPNVETYAQGAGALSDANRAAFNAAYGTAFATFALAYFDWSLDDPIDGDPEAIPSATYGAMGWSPLPTSGPDRIAGGFDAPRVFNQPSVAFWELWLAFRVAMLTHWVEDFAVWITTSAEGGVTWPVERYYSHQIPADYLNGRNPQAQNPTREPRLLSSASPLSTALIPPSLGLPGLTVLDRFELGNFGLPGGYNRTSLFLLDVLAGLPDGWGAPEYNPSWHIDVPPDTNVPLMRTQFRRAYDAGMRMFAFTPWPHLTAPIGTAMKLFLDDVKFQPRDTPRVAYAPPVVTGLTGVAVGAGSLAWSAQIFPGVPGLAWSQWPAFERFEVWSGPDAGFTTATGTRVGTTTQPGLNSLKSRAKTGGFFKVRAMSRAGVAGALSAAVQLDLGAPKCQRAVVKAAAAYAQASGALRAKCELARLGGKLAAATDCTTEAATAAALAKLDAKLASAIGKACGGADKQCGGSVVNESSGTTLAWPATCPGLGGACAGIAIGAGDCTGIASCIACVAGAGVTAMTGAAVAATPDADKARGKCQKAIAQQAQKLAATRSKALQKCWDARLGEKHANDCPNPGDGKAAGALAKAETAARAKICKACGGADKACGGADDLAPAALGYPAQCPDVPAPAGGTCEAPLATLGDLLACVTCATEAATTCVDRLPLPQIGPYPAICQ